LAESEDQWISSFIEQTGIIPGAKGSRTAEKVNFDVPPVGLTPEFTDQWECPATDGEVSAIVLDSTHLQERIFIKSRFMQHASPIHTEQTNAAVVAEHVRMYASKVGSNSKREKRGRASRHANEC
jgi:hypothetical protein